jgi:hypothetical protein
MSENIRPCRCLLAQTGKEETAADIKARIERLSEKERADSELYKKRLEVCTACDFLADGTCLKCGCYPEFRAAFAKNRCPAKKW